MSPSHRLQRTKDQTKHQRYSKHAPAPTVFTAARPSEMDDLLLRGRWESHIVLACITCEKVVLVSRTSEDLETARVILHHVAALLQAESPSSSYRYTVGSTVNLFLPTVCSSCSKSSSWKTLSISGKLIETWQPYLAMCAFLEGDLSLLGLSISMVHYEDIKNVMGADCVVRSVEINATPEAAVEVKPFLQSGFL
ncbi:hypothetical protein DL95DRAFT_399233 [Leptodontidium sp. 2 PMI_412]|nr:hypothetical protein DL95DRAFT_399233 [Leptodontidium sp. 2 PMI_412]